MEQKQKRYFKLQTVISLGFIALGIAIGGTISTLFYIGAQDQLLQDLQHRLANIASIAALQIDGDKHATLVNPEDMQSDVYLQYEQELFNIVKAEEELLYVYSMRQAEDGTIYFYLDAGRDPSIAEYQSDPIGEIVYEQPTDLLLDSFASPGGTVVEPEIYADEYGSFLSAYAPIYKSDGSLEGFIGADITADKVVAQERQLLLRSMLWFILSLPFTVLFGWFLGHRLARPTVELTRAARHIAEGNLEPIEAIPSGNLETYQLTQAINLMTIQLRELVGNLEKKIAERTLDVELRTQELETASRLARDAITTQDLVTLLTDTVNLIQDSFGLYHVSIFLTDDRDEFEILHAATGEAGQKLLEQDTRLRIGETGIVGTVAKSGKPRIALNVEADTVYLSHPLLPYARSEMTLPLVVNKRVIGVLDIQSSEQNAFDDNSVRIMQTLANQLAVSIENARLVKRMQDTLGELNRVYQAQIRQAWANQIEESMAAYEYDGLTIMPMNRDLPKDVLDTLQAGHAVAVKAKKKTGSLGPATLLVPLRLRGQLIGTVGIEKEDPGYIWSADEIAIVENAALQTVTSLENARLLEDSQRRAALEQSIGEITARISSATEFDDIVREILSQLGETFQDSDVSLRIKNQWD